MKLKKKIILNGKLHVLTGMHIGGSSEGVDIGGVDLGVIKDAITDCPYIPGSSLKGKMRSLLELTEGTAKPTYDPEKSPCSKLFGGINNREKISKSSRLIVRDAFMTEESKKMLTESVSMEMPYTEVKWENSIDRVQGKAQHPRQIERVPAGASFDVSFVVNVHDDDNEEEFMEMLKAAVTMLERDYLGGSGSRGYGQVKLDLDWDAMDTLNVGELHRGR
jgi:CRISPR-associated protein Csm3